MSRKSFLGWAAGGTQTAERPVPSYGLKKINAKAAAEKLNKEANG